MADTGMAGTRRPGRPRSEEAHGAILSAAIDLIREVGYDAVTMEGIAARAGVGKATLYRRWKEKETLVIEALGRIIRAIPVPDTGSARGDLMAMMRVALGMYGDPASHVLLSGLVAAMARSPAIAHAMRAGFDRAWRQALGQVLRRAIDRGELRADTEVEMATDVISGPFFYRYLMSGGPVDERSARELVEVALRAFGASGDEPSQ
ncbi:MAG TPA: TetR/AcrR family transcriptional regulator [Longimicrobium sp.]|nr:TetR/AcrR family transcriptional regulator [Longimicrobium sp.]